MKRIVKDNLLHHLSLLAAVTATAVVLLSRYSLKLWSDPVQWYCFGRDFLQKFAHAHLAYGFPCVIFLAAHIVGPLPAMLVNIPILLALVLLLAAFTAQLVSHEDPLIRKLAPPTAILLFLIVDRRLLLVLVSPYRDPLAFTLTLGSLILFLQDIGSFRTRWRAVASGALLALAASTRETSVLVIPAMLVTGVSTLSRERLRISIRWAVWWGVAFAVGSLPYLYQNALTSGHPLIPAQAARTLDTGFSLTPGVSMKFLGGTLPRTLAYLWRHYTPFGLLALFFGVAALFPRHRIHLLCVLSAFLTYLLFYGSYAYPVPRYLMVLDLFAIPMFAAGAILLIWWVLNRGLHTPVISQRVLSIGLPLVLIIAFTGIAGWPSYQSRHTPRFRLADARRLRAELLKYLPHGSRLVSGRFFGEFAACLITNPVIITHFLTQNCAGWHPCLPKILAAQLSGDTPNYAALTSRSLRHLLAGEYDLEPLGVIDLDQVHYPLRTKSRMMDMVMLRPWSNRVVTLHLTNRCAAPACLEVNVGRLSRIPRRKVVLRLNGRVLDESPSDYLNYYRIDSTNTTLRLTVQSDSPLPAGIRAEVHPFPLIMPTAFHGLRQLEGILSAAMRRYPRWKYAAVCDTAGLRLPALARHEEYLLVSLVVGVPSRVRPLRPQLLITAASNTLLSADLSAAPDRRSPWTGLSFAVPPLSATSAVHTYLPLKLVLFTDGSCADNKPTCVFLKRMEVMPASEFPPEIDIGGHGDNLWLARGFYDRETKVYANAHISWRWTSHKAEILILTRRPRTALSIEIDELAELRPGKDAPAFTFNGYPVAPVSQRHAGNGSRVVTYRIAVPAQVVTGRVNRLTISCPTWSPSSRMGSSDTRKLGIAVDRIRVRRADYDSR